MPRDAKPSFATGVVANGLSAIGYSVTGAVRDTTTEERAPRNRPEIGSHDRLRIRYSPDSTLPNGLHPMPNRIFAILPIVTLTVAVTNAAGPASDVQVGDSVAIEMTGAAAVNYLRDCGRLAPEENLGVSVQINAKIREVTPPIIKLEHS